MSVCVQRPTPPGTLRLSSVSSQDSGFTSQDRLFTRPPVSTAALPLATISSITRVHIVSEVFLQPSRQGLLDGGASQEVSLRSAFCLPSREELQHMRVVAKKLYCYLHPHYLYYPMPKRFTRLDHPLSSQLSGRIVIIAGPLIPTGVSLVWSGYYVLKRFSKTFERRQ